MSHNYSIIQSGSYQLFAWQYYSKKLSAFWSSDELLLTAHTVFPKLFIIYLLFIYLYCITPYSEVYRHSTVKYTTPSIVHCMTPYSKVYRHSTVTYTTPSIVYCITPYSKALRRYSTVLSGVFWKLFGETLNLQGQQILNANTYCVRLHWIVMLPMDCLFSFLSFNVYVITCHLPTSRNFKRCPWFWFYLPH